MQGATNMPKKRPPEEPEMIARIREELVDFQPVLEAVSARGEELLKDLVAEIKKRPLTSMAAAMGVGFIIAKLFSRRRTS
jgi:ElaB/YqjD/DUF883 family membrane-anchored ribosome-binding protein